MNGFMFGKMRQSGKISKNFILILMLLLILVSVFFMSVGLGSVEIAWHDVLSILVRETVTEILDIFVGSDAMPEVLKTIVGSDVISEVYRSIVLNIRLPRALATIVGGASLAVAGLLLQVFFRNAIVEPFVLGVSSGSTLFVGLILLSGANLGLSYISPAYLFFGAFLGAAAVMLLSVAIAHKVRNVITLLVVGLMIGYIASAATTVLVTFARQEQVRMFVLWTMGSFSGVVWEHLIILIVIAAIALMASFFMSKPLNAFLLGEEYAKSMGVSIKLFRISIIIISSVLSGIVTAIAGPVAFIGLAVPHIARMIFATSDNRVLIPASVLIGAALTGLCDLVARLVLAPAEVPISAVTSFVGAPIVIFLLLKKRNLL